MCLIYTVQVYFTGIDLVHVPGFAQQLQQPGSTFSNVFTPGELRRANQKPEAQKYEHLAGRWAAKEAFIKAWSMSYYGYEPLVHRDNVNWQDIEVTSDAWGRPAIQLHGELRMAFYRIRPSTVCNAHRGTTTVCSLEAKLSISHDGDYAVAHVLLDC